MISEEAICNLADTMQEAHSEALRVLRELLAEHDVKCVEIEAFKPAKLDRSRWEGCKYCETGSNDFDIREICVNVGNYINCEDFDCIGCQYFQSSEYCRRCGKPLTKEAWAELERKIEGL